MKKDTKTFVEHILECVELIHEYFGIDLELTWVVVTRDIPDLKEKMLRIREEL
ncbi:MAG: DUF86 domain-containing protein [Methanophagales archaeon]|nr:DUF86 domain-containing protein [Methanophagales archaeon]